MLFGRQRKNPIIIADKKVSDWTYATCGYCSTGCAIEIGKDATGAYSRRRLPPNPRQSCHPFHGKVATHSRAKLPPLTG